MEISVTFPVTSTGVMMLVRIKEPGQPPQFRSTHLDDDLLDAMDNVLAFIWCVTNGRAHWRQAWLWEGD